MEGHWLSAFLGSVRPEEDLRDFREWTYGTAS
jgi:hypothetical protein